MPQKKFEFRPRPGKDTLDECYAAGWKNPEDMGLVLSGVDNDPNFADERSPARARARARLGDFGSYVTTIGVVVDAEKISPVACPCSSEMMNWLFLPVGHSAKISVIEI